MRRCLNPLLHYAAIDQHVSVWLHKLNNRRCLLLNASLHFSMQSITKHIPDAVKQNLKPAHPRAMSCAQQRIQQGPRQPRPFPGDWRRRCWLGEGDGHSSVWHCRLFASALPPWPQLLRQHRTQLVPLLLPGVSPAIAVTFLLRYSLIERGNKAEENTPSFEGSFLKCWWNYVLHYCIKMRRSSKPNPRRKIVWFCFFFVVSLSVCLSVMRQSSVLYQAVET